MTNVTLWGLEKSVYTRIARLTLAEKGIEYRFEELDPFVEGGPPENHLMRHPFGRIPCLLHDDFCVYETRAITTYIDEVFAGPTLYPKEVSLRAPVRQAISIMEAYAYRPMVWDIFVQRVVVPEEGGLPEERTIRGALVRQYGAESTRLMAWKK